jgi:WD40 repeat protein
VFSLAYAPEHRLLFSASFDRDILVWNPIVEVQVLRLKGHHTSLVGLEMIEGASQLVSADMDGIFRVWDV